MKAFIVLLFVAVSLLLVALSCGWPPQRDEPRFAEGEATAVLLAYLRQRPALSTVDVLAVKWGCGFGPLYPPDMVADRLHYYNEWGLSASEMDRRTRYWFYEEASFNERYDGHGKWKVSTAIPAFVSRARLTMRPDRSREENLVRKAIPDASWNVYEFTGTVLRLTAPPEC